MKKKWSEMSEENRKNLCAIHHALVAKSLLREHAFHTRFKVPHHEFAKNDGGFRKFCLDAEVKPTARQAAKFRNKKGSAYKAHRQQIQDAA